MVIFHGLGKLSGYQMKEDLLIHSMTSFSAITLPILEAVQPTVIAEIGAEYGGHSRLLYEWLKQHNGKLLSIDCNPSQTFLDWIAGVKNVVQHIPQESLNAISTVSNVDIWFVDGDHNWYTVYHELKLIRELNKKQNRNTLIFLHDVCWPWSRRDLYYSPDRIPNDYCHPHTFEGGVTMNNAGMVNGGFQGLGAYAVALQEGGERNGVLTAVEDFIKEFTGEYCYAHVPAVFGLGVLFNLHHPQAQEIATIITPYHNNQLLQLLEVNRLNNYLKVIELQDNLSAQSHAMQQAPNQQQTEAIDNDLLSWEKTVISLVDMLDEESDKPDIWEKIGAQLPNDKSKLKQMLSYIHLLLGVPQEPEALKLLGILEVMGYAKSGNLKLAHKRLELLCASHPDCPLLLAVYTQTFNLSPSLT